MTEAAFWWVHQVTSKPYSGSSPYGGGGTYGDPVTVSCFVEDDTKMVLDSTGTEVVSSTTVYGPLDQADTHAPGSKVTLPSGRETHVLSLERHDSGSLDLDVDHFAAALA